MLTMPISPTYGLQGGISPPNRGVVASVHHRRFGNTDRLLLVARPRSFAVCIGCSSSSCCIRSDQDILSEAIPEGCEEACQGVVRVVLPYGPIFLLYSGYQDMLL